MIRVIRVHPRLIPMNNLYPIVVPASYFDLPPEARKYANPSLDAFGVVRPLGNDLYSLLVQVNGEVIKNVHEEDLAKAGLDRAGAQRVAIRNLSALATSSPSIQRQVNRTSAGLHFAVWLGDRFTSSCLLWPGLYDWARRELETDRLVVSAPQVQLLCVAARGDAAFRGAIRGYMDQLVSGMEKQISTVWFDLTPEGISPSEAE